MKGAAPIEIRAESGRFLGYCVAPVDDDSVVCFAAMEECNTQLDDEPPSYRADLFTMTWRMRYAKYVGGQSERWWCLVAADRDIPKLSKVGVIMVAGATEPTWLDAIIRRTLHEQKLVAMLQFLSGHRSSTIH